jgi:cell division protein FtsI/penicillin-binding protein 2
MMARRLENTELSPWRFRVVLTLFVFLAVGLLARLYYIQVHEHEIYLDRAMDQHKGDIILPATRGDIRSSDGFNLATTQPAYLVTADPSIIEDPARTAELIAEALYQSDPSEPAVLAAKTASGSARPSPAPTPTLDQKTRELQQQLNNRDSRYVVIARRLSKSRYQKIKEADLKGIFFYPEKRRFYPEGMLASQVLGFVGSDSEGNDQGYYGIEGYFDRDLRGKDGRIFLEKDAAGNPIPVGTYTPKATEEGVTITLTINRGLQYMIEQKLKSGVEQKKAESGSAILMEPSTGRILAMANFPTYDPNYWSDKEVQGKQLFRNSAIADAYEPGSVMKSFTTATGVELGIMQPKTNYVSAPYKLEDHTITNSNGKYYGNSTVTEMLQHSDNTGAAQFGLKIGRDRFIAALRKVGFDRPTGITLEGEGQSIIPSVQQWLPVTVATAAFGQGISVTPLQLLQMVATIANDGVQMKPTIIQSMTRDGQEKLVEPEEVGRVYSEATAHTVAGMLEDVVKYGEFRRLATQGYHIAGKTSTSQIPINGTYDKDKTITTFVGFAPAKDPKFVMLVKLNRPLINNSAETVVPIWMDMATDIMRHFSIMPDPASIPTITPTPKP